jgi:hypothetical protein
MKRIFTLFSILFLAFASRAQVIGMIGDFTSWAANNDVIMTSTDNVNWTVTNQAFLVSGGVKFRQDQDWATNWGSLDFPTGTGTQGGDNIPVPAGIYDVTFNSVTGAYTFTEVVTSFDNIGFNGGFNAFGTPEAMVTVDGIQYLKLDYYFDAPGVKFVNSTTNQTFGGAMFPTGAAVVDGPEIPLTSGYYNVGFDKGIPGYAFQQSFVGIIGSAIPNTGWDTCVTMTSIDGGVTNTLLGFTITDGAVKFRVNGGWATNWGGTDFPSGTGELNGMDNDIPVTAGTYDITFNRLTGEYDFAVASIQENIAVKVTVAPNPAKEVVTFNVDAADFNISIIDLSGKIVATSTTSEMNISNLNNGLYTYIVKTSNGVATGKLIKQ